MITARKLHANRANGHLSTGPRTATGKRNASRNALRHGLTSPISANPVLSTEVEALTRKITGDSASQEQRELAIQIAEAQIDLLRVRRARWDLLDRALGDYGYRSPTLDGKRVKILIHLAQTLGFDANIPDEYRELFAPLRGPDKLASILCDLAASLSVMDRYERRALSRRKFAIRTLDAARASGLQGSIL